MNGTQEVVGSIPSISTNETKGLQGFLVGLFSWDIQQNTPMILNECL